MNNDQIVTIGTQFENTPVWVRRNKKIRQVNFADATVEECASIVEGTAEAFDLPVGEVSLIAGAVRSVKHMGLTFGEFNSYINDVIDRGEAVTLMLAWRSLIER